MVRGDLPLVPVVERRPARRRRQVLALLTGLSILGALCLIDLALGTGIAIEGTFVIAPLTMALFGVPRVTLLVAATAVVAAVVIGSPQTPADPLVMKAGLVALGGILAVVLSRRQEDANARAAGIALLDRVSRIGDQSLPLQASVDGIVEVVLEDFADGCAIQVAEGDSLRTLTEAGNAGPPDRLPGVKALEGDRILSLPLTARDRFLGVLDLRRDEEPFTQSDGEFGVAIAKRAGRVLDNAGLFDDADSLSRRLDTVVSLLDEGVFIFNPHGELLFVNDSGCRYLGVDPDAEQKELRVKEAAEGYGVELETGRRFGTLAEGANYATANAVAWEGVYRLWHFESGDQMWMKGKARHIKSSRDELLWSILTLEDVTELKEQEIKEKILARVGGMVDQGESLEEVLQGFADSAVPLFADCCWIYLPTGDGLLDAAGMAHRDHDGLVAMKELNSSYPVRLDQQLKTVEAQERGTSAIFEIDPELLVKVAADETALHMMQRIDNRSGMVVPLRDGDDIVGVMALGNGTGSRVFSEEDAGVAETIAQRCAEVINRERGARENAEIAKMFELGLKPSPLPSLPGVETAEIFESATRLSQIGGDFYEGFETDHHWNVMIGDVVGRGAAAASLTLETRDTLRVALQLTEDPAEALSRLDARLRERGRNEQVTVALVRIEKSDPERLRILSAGHPLPLLVDSASVREVGESGPLLGPGIGGGWPEEELGWEPGSTLVLYTDGLSEARRNGELFGCDRIVREISDDRNVDEIARAIEGSLERFNGSAEGQQQDDVAAIILRQPRGSGTPSVT